MLDANIARAQRDYKEAASLLSKAALAEDALNYDEPPEAQAKNPRALFGLAECLRAQGKSPEEAVARKQFEEGWQHADTRLLIEDL